jgi:LPS sulfotransferase NodH
MLSSILQQTGIAGNPREFFGPTLVEELLAQRLSTKAPANDVRDLFSMIFAESTTPNGVFGMKLLGPHTHAFIRRCAERRGRPFTSLRDAIDDAFPGVRYIRLTRSNRVAQAISMYCAILTQEWIRLKGAKQTRQREVLYNRFAIQRCYQEVAASEAYWDGYFSRHSIEPLTISYEHLIVERSAVIQHVLRYLELPSDIPIPEPKTEKLASEESEAWEKEFRDTDSLPPIASPEYVWAPY